MDESDLVVSCLHLLQARFRESSSEDLRRLFDLVSDGDLDLTPAEADALAAEYRRRAGLGRAA